MADLRLFSPFFSDLTDAAIELRCITPDHGVVARLFTTDFMAADEFANKYNGEAHVYYGVASRKQGRESGTKEDVHSASAVWVDIDAKQFDGNKQAAFDAIQRFALPPSIVVDSGHGYHVYWLLDKPCSDVEVFENATSKLRLLLGADATFDITRILRVPGTLNIKTDPPVECTTMRVRDDIKYELEDIVAAIGLPEPIVVMITTGDIMGRPSRSERDAAVLNACRKAGISKETRYLIFQETAVGNKYQELGPGGDRYLERTIRRMDELAQSKQRSEQQFQERGDCYFIGDVQVSTFTFKPEKLLVGSASGVADVLYGTVRSGGKEWPGVTLPRSAFTRDTLQKSLWSIMWSWLGSDRQVRALLPYLVAQLDELGMPTAIGVSTLGRHEDCWVTPTGALTHNGYLHHTEAPFVFISNTGNTLQVTVDPVLPDNEIKTLVEQMWPKLSHINKPEVFWPTLGWFMATPFKPLLEEIGVRFPTLHIYGTRGAGKTATLTQIMQPMLGYDTPRTYDCSTTQFSILSLFSVTNSIPVSLSEFRRSSLGDAKYSTLLRQMLLAYDGASDTRGTQAQQIKQYPLTAPFTLDGEDAISDPAAKERALIVYYSPENIRAGTEAAEVFREVAELPLHKFTGRYIQSTLECGTTQVSEMWEECKLKVNETFTGNLPDRVRRNMTVAYFGMKAFERFVSRYTTIELPSANVLRSSLEEIVTDGMDRGWSLVDDLVEDVINYIASGDCRDIFWRWDNAAGVLWIHLSTAKAWWYQFRRRQGQPILDSPAIKMQLKERDATIRAGSGQYVCGSRAQHASSGVGSKHMFGVSLEEAVASGMDIPDTISMTRIYIDYAKTKTNKEDTSGRVQVQGKTEDTPDTKSDDLADN